MGNCRNALEDSLLRACYIWGRHHCGSTEGRGYYGMTCAKKCTISTQLFGFSRILPTVRRGFFRDCKSDHGIAEEKQEVCMDQEVHRSILKVHWDVEDNVDTRSPRHGKGFPGMHIRIQGRFRRSIDARRSSDRLHLKEIKKA
jgi:hypothetical protein